MEASTNIKIISALANGVDPITGELLPSDAPYNHPEVIRALFSTLEHIKAPATKRPKIVKTLQQKRTENVANGIPENAGLPWDSEHKEKLAAAFKSGESIAKLATLFGRTSGAIIAELKKQGLIEQY